MKYNELTVGLFSRLRIFDNPVLYYYIDSGDNFGIYKELANIYCALKNHVSVIFLEEIVNDNFVYLVKFCQSSPDKN